MSDQFRSDKDKFYEIRFVTDHGLKAFVDAVGRFDGVACTIVPSRRTAVVPPVLAALCKAEAIQIKSIRECAPLDSLSPSATQTLITAQLPTVEKLLAVLAGARDPLEDSVAHG